MTVRLLSLLACSTLAACFRVGSSSSHVDSAPAPDHAQQDAPTDAPMDAPRDGPARDALLPEAGVCPPGGVTQPVIVSELSSTFTDRNPTLTEDLLEIYFTTTRPGGPGGKDTWVATRASAAAPFGAPQVVAGVNWTGEDSDPEISSDGLELFFASDRPSSGWGHIHVTTRPSRTAPFSAPLAVAAVNSIKGDYDPSLSKDALTIYISSSRPNGNDSNIWVAGRASRSGSFSTPVVLPGLVNSQYSEQDPAISANGLFLLFSSTGRPGGMGGVDIWVAWRKDKTGPFAAPALAAGLGSTAEQGSAFLTRDGKWVYFFSDRPGGVGGDDIYRAELCP